ncbi:type II toxin-antitoxin system RelE/ParE family toxin [Synechococcus sp. CS-1332]|uniref:type II toxin-antitoxin system RelE/ParE family toxin n=1 Tax=Synechococcus sp. CS-1332 TaxID=2847972 RepID=UPI0037D9B380
MIRLFRCRETQALFEGKPGQRFGSFARVAFRKLAILDAAACLNDLQVPPGNRLEPLKGRPPWPAQHPHQRPVPALLCLDGSRARGGRNR